ncbi:hypothetical protein LCGC14_2320540 [marine sediment metagenome]|uniref:histidine kinase n=1 Tax=marine sediment metagenome TaxID=412755 RepID=A0A0F9CIH6_9ZZZZ
MGREPGTCISCPQRRATSVQPICLAARAGNSALRSGLLVKKAPLELSSVARTAALKYVDLFQTNGLEFHQEFEPVRVRGDENRLEQIVDNLLSNALRYTERGGRVTLRVGRREDKALLEVEDTGIGIPPNELSDIFRRFWRGEKSRSRVTGGAGIGLAIVRDLTEAHDGQVDVDSTPGRGSSFRVSLPLA